MSLKRNSLKRILCRWDFVTSVLKIKLDDIDVIILKLIERLILEYRLNLIVRDVACLYEFYLFNFALWIF